ncbi:sigma 54-interacting transcriptional regulator [Pantoea sp. 18069]|uniref:sigma 54-interacting transcriptional regulator n=1 Tax=Pantoea sp. 18069 TaxID=2681415 RepID=UPI00135810AE|nr:sigma 54-interacting transcriptional regulator [Pantoea sp. 18069]
MLADLQAHKGFALLFKELLRVFGQESTCQSLKRHGFHLGRCEAVALPESPTDHSMQSFLDSLRGHLQGSRVRPECLTSDDAQDGAIEWNCVFDVSQCADAESLVQHENALVWLITGYATGFLQQHFGRNFHVTYARQVMPSEVIHQFFARAARNAQDVDRDLPALHLGQGAAPPVSASRQAPAEGRALPQRLSHRILREGSEMAAILQQVAPTDATILLLGESGVGKSLIAGELHAMSLRSQQPWVEINCAAIPEQLFESELFGAERGAFSGATLSRKGKFEQAHGGTIFLDEVALLSPGAQSKLLRVLQTGELERLGSTTTVRCDIRVIAATNEQLEKLVHEGRFREDLYYRLNVFPVHIQPLRERRNEIPELAAGIIQRLSHKYRKRILRCSAQAREVLLNYAWPGNIRELENVLERAVILCPDGSPIQAAYLGEVANKCHAVRAALSQALVQIGAPAPSPPVAASPANAWRGVDDWASQVIQNRVGSLNAVKDALLRAALRHNNDNLTLAAANLGMTRARLSYHLKKIDEPQLPSYTP